jgi:hypothetical protein
MNVTEWDQATVKQFEEYLRLVHERENRHGGMAEVGDRVETPDQREWIVVRVLPSDQLDLQREGQILTVPREFVRVIEKTPPTPEVGA